LDGNSPLFGAGSPELVIDKTPIRTMPEALPSNSPDRRAGSL